MGEGRGRDLVNYWYGKRVKNLMETFLKAAQLTAAIYYVPRTQAQC